MFDRSSLFKKALTACGKLRVQHPSNVAVQSVVSQLHYLIDLEAGRNKDRSRLDTIVIGVLARREIAFIDAKTAALLEKVADEARKMEAATSKAPPASGRKPPARPAMTSASRLALRLAPKLAPKLTLPGALGEAATRRPAPAPVPVPAKASPARRARPAASAAPPKRASFLTGGLALAGTLSGAGVARPGGRKDGRANPLKSAYLQCRMYHRNGLVRLLRMEGYDDFQARSIIDNHPSGLFRMTEDDLAFEARKAQRLEEKQAHKPLGRA